MTNKLFTLLFCLFLGLPFNLQAEPSLDSSNKIKIILDTINLGNIKPEAFSQTLNFQLEVRLRYFEKLRNIDGRIEGYNLSLDSISMFKPIAVSPKLALVAPQKEHEVHQVKLTAEIDLNELDRKLAQIPNPKYSIVEVEVKQQGIIGSVSVVVLKLNLTDLEQILTSRNDVKKLSLAGRKDSTTYFTVVH